MNNKEEASNQKPALGEEVTDDRIHGNPMEAISVFSEGGPVRTFLETFMGVVVVDMDGDGRWLEFVYSPKVINNGFVKGKLSNLIERLYTNEFYKDDLDSLVTQSGLFKNGALLQSILMRLVEDHKFNKELSIDLVNRRTKISQDYSEHHMIDLLKIDGVEHFTPKLFAAIDRTYQYMMVCLYGRRKAKTHYISIGSMFKNDGNASRRRALRYFGRMVGYSVLGEDARGHKNTHTLNYYRRSMHTEAKNMEQYLKGALVEIPKDE